MSDSLEQNAGGSGSAFDDFARSTSIFKGQQSTQDCSQHGLCF